MRFINHITLLGVKRTFFADKNLIKINHLLLRKYYGVCVRRGFRLISKAFSVCRCRCRCRSSVCGNITVYIYIYSWLGRDVLLETIQKCSPHCKRGGSEREMKSTITQLGEVRTKKQKNKNANQTLISNNNNNNSLYTSRCTPISKIYWQEEIDSYI